MMNHYLVEGAEEKEIHNPAIGRRAVPPGGSVPLDAESAQRGIGKAGDGGIGPARDDQKGSKKNTFKPWLKAMWCIPPRQNAAFVWAMERVLDVYKRPLDRHYPVICMDESTVQCVREVREPWPMRAGRPERYDVEYERNGVAHLIQFYAPFMGWRRIEVGDNHAAQQWAEGVCQ